MTGTSNPLRGFVETLQLDRLWLLFQRRETRHLRLYLNLLRTQNRFSRRSVVASGGPVVSLTTYGVRIQSVYLAIESIAAASFLPSRFILWLDDASAFHNAPDTLKKLQARGLEVRLTDNLGPHKKYYPALDVMGDLNQPLVVADDDHLYPRNWLLRLMDAYRDNSGVVNCYRARVIRLLQDRFAPYADWKSCTSDKPSMLHLATGCSGIALPPALLQQLRSSGTRFKLLCPAADDVWLNVNALRIGMPTRQIGCWQRNFPIIPGTQEQRLMNANVDGSQNDVQIAKTFTAQDFAILQQETAQLALAALISPD